MEDRKENMSWNKKASHSHVYEIHDTKPPRPAAVFKGLSQYPFRKRVKGDLKVTPIKLSPPCGEHNKGFSGQYGAGFGGGAYTAPQQGGAYHQAGGKSSQTSGKYPAQGFAQPGYGYSQQSTTTVVVTQPGNAGNVVAMPRPPDYMAGSIFACLCCFWPTGICAIYYASQASKLAAEDDMAGAIRMSNNARNLMISSIAIGGIWITLVIVLRMVIYADYYDNYNRY